MRIRAITCFVNLGTARHARCLAPAGALFSAARPAFRSAGYDVQTVRVATPPFPWLVRRMVPEDVLSLARLMERGSVPAGCQYVSLGPALPSAPGSYSLIPAVLAETTSVFLSGSMTDEDGRVSLDAVRACADVIRRNSRLSPTGIENLRFAALANVPAGVPFFPAAYGDGGPTGFALATEAADLAVDALSKASTLAQACAELTASVEKHAAVLSTVARQLADTFGIPFRGIDFTPAPFPEEARSIGAAMERMGVPAVGRHGSLSAAALLVDAVEKARFRRAGFCGLMLPILEDATLARRAAEGELGLRDLLLCSTVCGTGLDTVPLPGDATTEGLAALLLDVAVLAVRLNKPLTARLMPIPGKCVGDPTGFDFPYFANSRVMGLAAEGVGCLLAGAGAMAIATRPAAAPAEG